MLVRSAADLYSCIYPSEPGKIVTTQPSEVREASQCYQCLYNCTGSLCFYLVFKSQYRNTNTSFRAPPKSTLSRYLERLKMQKGTFEFGSNFQ